MACLVFLSGFTFSDPQKLTQELKEEIKKELLKIAEKTPSAKLKKEWQTRRDEAAASLEKAQVAEAQKYCPEKWDEAVALFEKAKYYASKRSYRKAIFLAKRADEKAKEAYTASKAVLLQQKDKLNKAYKDLRSRADEIFAGIPSDADELNIKAGNISLEIEDARLAIELDQFDEAQKELSSANKKLNELERLIAHYKKTHPPPQDEDGP
ncbi:MAG: hypothetical protein DSZ23_05280 [Thermodesulfatator sp.]|nr:MAG: hypothetical protein DSZ23_05280 [Thermodesulfatator sp.]